MYNKGKLWKCNHIVLICILRLPEIYRIRQKIRRIKFSPIARPFYWGKIFAKFNFANRVRSTLQKVMGGGRAYRIMRMHIRSLVPSPPPQLSSSLAVRIRVIRTASDDSCGGGLGTRLAYTYVRGATFHNLSWKSEVSHCSTNSILAGVFSYLDFHLLVQLHVWASLFRPHASGHGLL